jgi:hypothetical protein
MKTNTVKIGFKNRLISTMVRNIIQLGIVVLIPCPSRGATK